MPKPQISTQEQAAKIAVAGMFSKADRKLSRKRRRQGRLAKAAAVRRIELRHRAIEERRRLK